GNSDNAPGTTTDVSPAQPPASPPGAPSGAGGPPAGSGPGDFVFLGLVMPELLFTDLMVAGTGRRAHREGSPHGEDEDQGDEADDADGGSDPNADLFEG
ncbi:MAG: hypothetical protein LC620_08795, partial [Halobacteriales archaeon]|nr:hypothetical protein [Halobacteriales archaeon]